MKATTFLIICLVIASFILTIGFNKQLSKLEKELKITSEICNKELKNPLGSFQDNPISFFKKNSTKPFEQEGLYVMMKIKKGDTLDIKYEITNDDIIIKDVIMPKAATVLMYPHGETMSMFHSISNYSGDEIFQFYILKHPSSLSKEDRSELAKKYQIELSYLEVFSCVALTDEGIFAYIDYEWTNLEKLSTFGKISKGPVTN